MFSISNYYQIISVWYAIEYIFCNKQNLVFYQKDNKKIDKRKKNQFQITLKYTEWFSMIRLYGAIVCYYKKIVLDSNTMF